MNTPPATWPEWLHIGNRIVCALSCRDTDTVAESSAGDARDELDPAAVEILQGAGIDTSSLGQSLAEGTNPSMSWLSFGFLDFRAPCLAIVEQN